MRIGLKGAGMSRAVEPDELLIGLWAGRKVLDAGHLLAGLGGNTDLLWNFAVHSGVVLLARIDMPAHAGGPATGFPIFVEGTSLQKKASIRMEEPQVNGPMEEAAGMDLGPWGRSDDPIAGVDKVKFLVGWIHRGFAIRLG